MSHLSLSQAIEAVVNRQHVVTLDDAHPDGSADSSVHPSAGGADVHDGHVDVALVQRLGSVIIVKRTSAHFWRNNCKFLLSHLGD